MQVLSPLHTMLASIRQPHDGPSQAGGAPPPSESSYPPSNQHPSHVLGSTHHGPPSRASAACADGAAEADGITSLVDVEEAAAGAARGLGDAAESVEGVKTAPCIGFMRARGLRQQRVSREMRCDSGSDMTVLLGGAGLHGAAGEAGGTGGGLKAEGVSQRLGSPVVGRPPGGAGAVLVRQRMRSRQARPAAEVKRCSGILFGQDVARST